MSHDQQPPSPYGIRPQGGGYGPPQPGPPPQGGYGQPQPGYSQPNGRLPQQGYGPPQPPQPRGKGKRNGIIIGVVVAVLAVGAGVFVAHKGNSGSSGLHDDGKKYTLTTPDTVAGDYVRSPVGSTGPQLDDTAVGTLKALGVDDAKSAGTLYLKGSQFTGVFLSFDGVYGTVKDPGKALDGMFALLDKGGTNPTSDGSKVTVSPLGTPQTVKPAGLKPDALMKCQKINETQERDGQKIPFKTTICAWADYSTVAYVSTIDDAHVTDGTATWPSIADTAALAAKVRADVEVPAS
ncbi:hypothetical protein [Streptomyces sp. NBC_00448]|uniref:hypothetical protein n=1 Tax=Streptomyces sp. NBC_00448 TaxID=2903652 RepID=UPI002E24FDD2